MLGFRPIAALPLADNGPAFTYFVAGSRSAYEYNSENYVVITRPLNTYALFNPCNQLTLTDSINDVIYDGCNQLDTVSPAGDSNEARVVASENTYN